jgi:Ni/Co efflux regulator RcnB
MKKIILTITAVTAMAAAALPTAASAQSINQRQDRLEWRIEQGERNGSLTRYEARHLKRELRETQRLEHRYRRDGLTRWERADLDRRFDRIHAQIRYERHDRDRDYGHGYGYGHDRPYRW